MQQKPNRSLTIVVAVVVTAVIVAVVVRRLSHNRTPSPQHSSLAQGPFAQGSPPDRLLASCKHAPQTVTQGGLTVTTNIRYMTVSQGGLCLDVYRPAGATSDPAVALLHSSTNEAVQGLAGRDALSSQAIQLAESGFVAVNIDWPPSPTYRIPIEITAVDTALSDIESHGSAYGINPDAVGLLGTSGGGVLAGYVATQHIPYLKAVVTWSGAFDPTAPALRTDRSIGATVLDRWFGCSDCSLLSQYSALQHVSSATPPFAMFNSMHELIPVSQPEAMNNALRVAGVPHELTLFPGSRHAVAYSSDAIGPTIQWFQKYLG